ncbi:carcinoembryonic antigen-related cell adhesion molecule 1 [Anableps anableps]
MESPLVFFLILTTITFTDRVHSQSIHASENPLPVGSNVTLSSNTTVTIGTWTFNEPISNVTLLAERVDLVEFNDTAKLICSVSTGSSLSYKWLAGNSIISSGEGVQFSSGSAILSIVNVTRDDQGPHRCNVSNGLGYEVSSPVNLTISYGPSNTTMTVMPVKYMYRSGSNITLSCSTDSSPTAKIQWMFDEVSLNQSGLQLDLQNVTEDNKGTYKCVFYNMITMRFSSKSTEIRVMDPLTAVVISQTSGPAILDEMFSLHCDVTGPIGSFQWWKNGSLIAPDNRTVFKNDNKTLTLNPVKLSDGGKYMCHAFNLVSNMTSSPFAVVVNYGPKMPVLMGPNVVKSGNNVTLSCTAESVPLSLYQWHFNGSVVSSMSKYMTPPLTEEMSGEYTCMALNNITGKNSTASLMLTVIDPIRSVQVEPQMNLAVEGHPYNLICKVDRTVDHIYWMRNGEKLYPDNRTLILMENMTIRFMNIQRNDAGDYQCMAVNAVGNMTSKTFMLDVNYGPEMPIIMGPSAVKTGDNATLKCWAKSEPPSLYQWHFNGSLVSNMSEYTTPPLREEMSEKYICMALNNITGKNSSASIMLTVVVGPDKPTIDGPEFGEAGRNAVFNCSATSMPPSNYTWWFNDSLVANTSEFIAGPLSFSMSGKYTCMAHNHVTGKNSTNSTTLTVIEAIESVMIQSDTTPINNKSFTLTCHIVGSYDTIYWMKDDMQLNLNASDPPMYIIEKNMLHFIGLTKQHNGPYQCVATNRAGHHKSQQYALTVNYGPLNVNISGPESAKDGASVSLKCTADSQPESDFHWFLNNQSSPLMNGSVISFSATRGKVGKYICIATNPVTNITMMQNKTFAIEDHASASHIPNKGALLFMGLCSFLAHLLFL